MAKFKPLVDSSVKQAEAQVFDYWKDINILEKTLEKGKDDPSFVFYEGPPTANGNPGVHHVLSRTLKDSVCRYKTMSGYQVKRKAGWDTHGLPVEIQVEKELGLTSKQQIEEYGIAEFNQKCRESVFSFEKQWRIMTERMAYEV
ncbi:TPA: class I tRNA ligase family protein, partial [Clostridioides difficile]|nr:class I tRNA ligase family protein [Clostridioides difficile]